MAYIILPHRWHRQPQSPVGIDWTHPSARALRIAWMPAYGNRLRGLAPITAGGSIVNRTVYPSVPGIGWGFSADASSGIDFGAIQPLQSNTASTLLAHAAPTASSTQFEVPLSQRNGGVGNFEQIALYSNFDGVSLISGEIAGYWRNTDGTNGLAGTSTGGTAVNGLPHVFVAGNSTTASSGYVIRDGQSLALANNSAMSGTIISASQQFKIGNVAQYTTNGVYAHVSPLFLIMAWDRRLPPDEARELSIAPYQIFRPLQRRIYVAGTAGAGQTVAVGQSSETDAAQAIARSKLKSISQATATNTAQPLTAVKTIALGIASETDAAQSVSVSKSMAVGLASETDSAQSVSSSKHLAVGLASETDAAQTITARKSLTLGAAAETDSAQAVSARKALEIGLAEETDEALGVSTSDATIVDPAEETDTAQPIGKYKAKAIGINAETDTALPVIAVKSLALGLALEINAALPLSTDIRRLIGIATEIDEALPLVTRSAVPITTRGRARVGGAGLVGAASRIGSGTAVDAGRRVGSSTARGPRRRIGGSTA